MSKIEETKKFIVEYLDKIIPGGETAKIYKDKFDKMTDQEFHEFMVSLKEGTTELILIAPNFSQKTINVKRNIAIARELGHDFWQRILIPAEGDSPAYLTPKKYLVVDSVTRRQAQLLSKKISIPEDNKSIDNMTGQPTGKSKGSKISYPETQVLAAYGLDRCLEEFLKYRGGDIKGFNAKNTASSRNGTVRMDSIKQYAGGVISTRTFKSYLYGMHLDNTL